MNTLSKIAAIGSIVVAAGCAESPQIEGPATPVVTVGQTAVIQEGDESADQASKHQLLVKAEEESEPVKIILESNRRYRRAMAIIGPIVRDHIKNYGGVSNIRCFSDPEILAMQQKNHEITERAIKARDEALKKGPPDLELDKCWVGGQDMPLNCGPMLMSSEEGRILVEDKKAEGEYMQALEACFREEFKDMLAKKP